MSVLGQYPAVVWEKLRKELSHEGPKSIRYASGHASVFDHFTHRNPKSFMPNAFVVLLNIPRMSGCLKTRLIVIRSLKGVRSEKLQKLVAQTEFIKV